MPTLTKNAIRARILARANLRSGRKALASIPWQEMGGAVGKALEMLLAGRSQLRAAYSNHLVKRLKKDGAAKMTFALDGRLVGDIGELIAAELFDLDLLGTRSKDVDAETQGPGGHRIQIKATFKDDSLCIKHKGDYFIGLQLREDAKFRVVYNGPAAPVMCYLKSPKAEGHKGRRKAGKRLEPITLGAWAVLNLDVSDQDRIPLHIT